MLWFSLLTLKNFHTEDILFCLFFLITNHCVKEYALISTSMCTLVCLHDTGREYGVGVDVDIPFHNDEQALVPFVEVLVYVDDVYDVCAE